MPTTNGAISRQQAVESVKAASVVYGWVRLSEHDGVYVQLSKRDAIRAIREFPFEDEGGYLVRVERDSVYIN